MYYDGDDTSTFRERLLAAIEEARLGDLFAGIGGLTFIGNINVTAIDEEEDDGAGVIGIVGGAGAAGRGLSTGGIVAVSVSALGLLLILLLLLRRRQIEKDDHAPLNPYDEIDDGMGKYQMDEFVSVDEGTILSSDLSSPPSKEYQSRLVNVVGEENSEVSGWTGYTAKKSTDSLNGGSILEDLSAFEQSVASGQYAFDHNPGKPKRLGQKQSTMNVHRCASATCEICLEKQYRPKFLGATPFLPADVSPTRLPSNAKRMYAAPDTVEL